MKLTQEQFKQFILEEVKNIAIVEGWIKSTVVVVVTESTEQTQIEGSPTVVAEEPKIEVAEVKRLAEEFTRMKALVDFRSPLLNKDNQ